MEQSGRRGWSTWWPHCAVIGTKKKGCRKSAAALDQAFTTALLELGQLELHFNAHTLVDLPLLQNRQCVVGDPVEHQAAGKKKNMTEKAKGMNHINLACKGSGGPGSSG